MQTTLTIQQQKVIEGLLKNRPKSIKANKTLTDFAEQGYGTLSGKTIHYTAQDFANFEQLIGNSFLGNSKLTTDEFSQLDNRLEVAKYNKNEKSNHVSVFGQQILVVGMGCDIPLCAMDNANLTEMTEKNPELTMPATPIGVLPTILPEYLDGSRMHKLIIIENGQLMTHWWQWRENLPTNWQNAVLLYRGHGDNIAKLLAWLTTLSSQCEVLLCFDMDLSGLQMISDYTRQLKKTGCQVSVLLPNMLISNTACSINPAPAYNQPEKISLQLAKVSSTAILPTLQPIYQTLISHNIALMQEHILQDKTIEWAVVGV
ncbi:hypothetical protein [Psychrobacter sp. I-STPA6b]|uniref:DUF7281 domain-containing protein n=1 Tax=Psychrobacter sp. I-STPA6b TaxID=2585718 RepID=UPI001D0C248B|nr:hypothetical protein [Psychrobacter sp. I-STPA6b]